MKLISSAICGILIFLVTQASADTFKWTDGGSANNWVGSKNWKQNPGAGDYPGQKDNVSVVELDGSFSDNTSKFDVDFTTSSSPATETISQLLISTDSSSDQWLLADGSQQGTLNLTGELQSLLASGGTAEIDVDLNLGSHNVTWQTSGNRLVLNGALNGQSGAVLNSSGSSGGGLTLNTAGNFSGTINVAHNTLDVENVNALKDATINLGGTLDYVANTKIGALTGSSGLTVNANLYVGGNNASTTFNGGIGGSSTLHKIGTGTLTLGGGSSFSGTTYIDAGQIKFASGNALRNSEVWLNVNDGLNINGLEAEVGALGGAGDLNLGSGSLIIDGSQSVFYLGNISGTGTIEIDNTGTQTFGGNNTTFLGNIYVAGGAFEVSADENLGAASVSLVMGNARLKLDAGFDTTHLLSVGGATNAEIQVSSGSATWGGLIKGSSSSQIVKTGNGELQLTNNDNTYGGTLNIQAGTVSPSATALQNATVNVGLNDGLTLTGGAKTIGALSGSGNLDFQTDLTVGGNNRSTTYTGDRSGNASLTKVGTGILTLGGVSTRMGTTTVSAGGLRLAGNTNDYTLLSALTLESGTVLNGTGRSSDAIYVNSGAHIAPGHGTNTIRAALVKVNGTYDCEIDGANADRLVTAGYLFLNNGTLNLIFTNGAPTQPAYIIASYGAVVSPFVSISNLPTGYNINYAYNGKNVALVQDNVAPTVTSITPETVGPTNAASLSFEVTFSEPVKNFDAFNDLAIAKTGTANAAAAIFSGSNADYIVTLTNITGEGTLALAVSTSGNVQDLAGNALASSVTSAAVLIDRVAPTVTSITPATAGPTNATSLSFGVVFSEPVKNFDAFNDVVLSTSDTANATGAIFSGSGANYTVRLTGISGDGTLTLAVATNNDVQDLADNALASSITSAAVTLDHMPPVITLNGSTNVTLSLGGSWTDPGATATDNLDGNVSVVVGGDTVDTSVSGTYLITYNATDAAGNQAVQVTRTVTVLSGYKSWIASYNLTGTNAAFNADPDGDGAKNGYEWATGTNPTNAASFTLLSITSDGADAPLHFTRNTNATDVTILVQRTTGLTGVNAWTGIATNLAGAWTSPSVVNETGTGNPVNVEISNPVTNNNSTAYYRLEITQP